MPVSNCQVEKVGAGTHTRTINSSSSSDERMKSVKENSILSFNKAADYVVDYVEFDVQVTKDNVPVIFHDDEIITGKENSGGTETYTDIRRNSLDEVVKLCLENGLQGIVSDVRGLLRNQEAVSRIKEALFSILTYGELNNVREAVNVQYLMGVEGVLVEFVGEISEVVSDLIKPVKEEEERIIFTQSPSHTEPTMLAKLASVRLLRSM
ncbi:hypothetical protein C5167_037886 [Papaver somniferum]|uniref:glycerophosphodiester phosphodiesterase n=1 Tax=Papaver somniferum TaxID=3469 RepID=A0A4Y7I7L9_PAPSO|nr:hypothetical protein C5167_037886 [Papaver somniferum]